MRRPVAPKPALAAALHWGVPLLALLGAAWLQLLRGGPYYAFWVQDIFVPLEATRHMLAGERPHLDFPSPVGLLYLGPHWLAARLFGLSAATVVQANAMAGLAAAAAVLLLARGRLPRVVGSGAALYAGLVAASPRQLGYVPGAITYNASYNRYGWALAVALCLLVALPRTRGSAVRDGIAAGLLLAACVLVKVTYGLVGAGLVAAAMLTVRRNAPWRFGLAAAASGAAVLFLLQVSTGLVGAYAADLRAAAAVQADPARLGQALALAGASATGLLLVLLAGIVAGPAPATPGPGRAPLLRRLLMATAVAAAGVALGTQNHLALENPLLPAAGLVAVFGALPLPTGRRCLVAVLCMAGLVLPPALQDVAAIAWTAAAPAAADPALASLRGTPLDGLRLAPASNALAAERDVPVPDTGLANDVELVTVLADGMALLRRHAGPGTVVLSLTWTNPFPVLLGLPPVPHELLWWDADRTFSDRVHPDGAALFGAVDLVMIPRRYNEYGTTLAMQAIYAEPIAQRFEPAEETRFWRLLRRRR